jgi:RNA recognition motif-containing protein
MNLFYGGVAAPLAPSPQLGIQPQLLHSNVYVKNIPLEVSDVELETMFSPFGKIISAR